MDINIPFPNYVAIEKTNLDLQKLVAYAYSLKEKSRGRVLSNVGGWQSEDLNHKDKELQRVIASIGEATNKLKTLFSINEDFITGNLWININGKADFNRPHTHPRAVFSGVLYIKTPPDCGGLEFCNPYREIQHYDYYFKNFRHHTLTYRWYEAKENLLYIFPSWQEHYALPNRSDEDRISIAFNVYVNEKLHKQKY